jgi:hypothetical protein
VLLGDGVGVLLGVRLVLVMQTGPGFSRARLISGAKMPSNCAAWLAVAKADIPAATSTTIS